MEAGGTSYKTVPKRLATNLDQMRNTMTSLANYTRGIYRPYDLGLAVPVRAFANGNPVHLQRQDRGAPPGASRRVRL